MKKNLVLISSFLFVGACSSTPLADAPPWVKGPARIVENGYIIYIGSGEDTATERSQFLAESMALQDLANECSFVPKGTRVEDRYSEKQKHTYMSFAKVAVEFQECDEAKKANDPNRVQQLANVGFTEEIKKYQDIVEGTSPEADGSNLIAPDSSPSAQASSGSGGGSGNVHFFVMRQYVAYQNQVVILSPPNSYPPGAPQTVAYTNNTAPVTKQVQMYETDHPEIKNSPQTWSHTPDRPVMIKNQRPTNNGGALRPPPQPRGPRAQSPRNQSKGPQQSGPRRGRHRRGGFNGENP